MMSLLVALVCALFSGIWSLVTCSFATRSVHLSQEMLVESLVAASITGGITWLVCRLSALIVDITLRSPHQYCCSASQEFVFDQALKYFTTPDGYNESWVIDWENRETGELEASIWLGSERLMYWLPVWSLVPFNSVALSLKARVQFYESRDELLVQYSVENTSAGHSLRILGHFVQQKAILQIAQALRHSTGPEAALEDCDNLRAA